MEMTGIVAGVVLLIVFLSVAAVFILVNGYVSPFDNDCQQFWTPEDDKEYWRGFDKSGETPDYTAIITLSPSGNYEVEDYDKEFWGIDRRAEE